MAVPALRFPRTRQCLTPTRVFRVLLDMVERSMHASRSEWLFFRELPFRGFGWRRQCDAELSPIGLNKWNLAHCAGGSAVFSATYSTMAILSESSGR